MQSSTGSILLKAAALLFAVTLSTIYIVYQWPDSEPADSPAENKPAAQQADPIVADEPEPADPPGSPAAPGFDLNEALSKSGTIHFDKKPANKNDSEGGLFGEDDTEDAKE